MAKKTKKYGYRTGVTKRLIEYMEENRDVPWSFEKHGALAINPFNAMSGHAINGGNLVNLMMGARLRESNDPRWMTLKQANSLGYSIAKNSKHELVEFWDLGISLKADVENNELDEEDPENEAKDQMKPRRFFAQLFNGDDIVGLPELKSIDNSKAYEDVKQLAKASGIDIPLFSKDEYFGEEDYYASVIDILVHHTFIEDNEVKDQSEMQVYRDAFIIDIAKSQLNGKLGINDPHHRASVSRLIEPWVHLLKEEKGFLFKSAKQADLLVKNILSTAPDIEAKVEINRDENVIKEKRQRKLGSGISPLPNFIPEGAQPNLGTGRLDPRWVTFESMLRKEAIKFGVESSLEQTIELIEPKFSEAMDAAKENGYTFDDMNTMLTNSLVEEMKVNQSRAMLLNGFVTKIRAFVEPSEALEKKMYTLAKDFYKKAAELSQDELDEEEVSSRLENFLYGENGVRDLTKEEVHSLTGLVSGINEEIDDDFALTPNKSKLVVAEKSSEATSDASSSGRYEY